MIEGPNSPQGACVSLCNHRSRKAWAAYRQALDDHADAVDAWFRGGQRGDPPDEPEQPDVKFFPGDPLFCGRCLASARRALLDLDVLAGLVAAASDGMRGAGPSDGKVSGSKERKSVSPAAHLLDRMLGDLFDAEDEWRQMRGYVPRVTSGQRGGPRGSHPRSRTIGWLAERLADMLAHEDMAGLATTVFNWETVLRKAAKDDPASGRSGIRCTRLSCGERRVVWDPEVRYYRCGACDNLISDAEHDDRQAKEIEVLDAIEQAAPPPRLPHQVLVPAAGEAASGRA